MVSHDLGEEAGAKAIEVVGTVVLVVVAAAAALAVIGGNLIELVQALL